jgi:hypothetical protein
MAYREGLALSRVFYGWWVAVAFSLIIFVSTGIRFAVGPFLKPVVDDLGLDRGSFSLVISLFLCGLLLLGAGLFLTINMAGRPRVRSLLQPVAGGE